MKLRSSFPLQVAAVLGVSALALAWPLLRFASGDVRTAVAAGAGLGVLNVMLGYCAIRIAFHRSYTTFLKAVLGGMGLRLLVMLGAFVLLLTVFRLHAAALTISLLAFYTVFMILEIIFLQRQMSVRDRR